MKCFFLAAVPTSLTNLNVATISSGGVRVLRRSSTLSWRKSFAATLEPEKLPPSRPAVFDVNSVGSKHPCVSCGACCAHYRASFPFFEVKTRGIPEDMVQEVAFPYVAMKGTHFTTNIRCGALKGDIGDFGTLCGIYDIRPSCCRDFWPTLEDGSTRNEHCDKARKAKGLVPLSLEDWIPHNSELVGNDSAAGHS